MLTPSALYQQPVSNSVQGTPPATILRASLPCCLPSLLHFECAKLPTYKGSLNEIFFFAFIPKSKPLSLPSPALEPLYLFVNVFLKLFDWDRWEKHLHVFFTWSSVCSITTQCKYTSWVVDGGRVLLVCLVSVLPRAGQELWSCIDFRPFVVELQFSIDNKYYLGTWTASLMSLLTADKLCCCPNPLFNGENWKERRTVLISILKIFSFSFKYNWDKQ